MKESLKQTKNTPENRRKFFEKALDVLLSDKADDVFGIIAVLNDITVEQAKQMPYSEIMMILADCGVNEITSFFRFAMRVLQAI